MSGFAITAADGWRLAATLVRPGTSGRAVMVVNSAMGVPHRIYLPLAQYLAANGIASVLYDYRGIAGSAPSSLRDLEADVLDWARLDFPAAVAAARGEYPGLPLVLLGHSIGGQLFGLDRAVLEASALVGVAAQSGYFGHWSGLQRAGMWMLWHVVMPVLAPLCGYLPARRFGVGENLPRNVALQWASWGRHPLYLRQRSADPQRQYFDAIESPLLSIAIEGDAFAPLPAVEAYRAWFSRAPLTRVDVPARERLGHFGWFHERCGEPHWPLLLDWLDGVFARRAEPRLNASVR